MTEIFVLIRSRSSRCGTLVPNNLTTYVGGEAAFLDDG